MTTKQRRGLSGTAVRRPLPDEAGVGLDADLGDVAGRLCRGPAARLFETDTGDVAGWLRAAALCDRCPVLAACRSELGQVYPGWGPGRRGANPAAVVWAGAIFSPKRRLWTRHGLARLAVARLARTRRHSATTTASHEPATATATATGGGATATATATGVAR